MLAGAVSKAGICCVRVLVVAIGIRRALRSAAARHALIIEWVILAAADGIAVAIAVSGAQLGAIAAGGALCAECIV